MNPANGPYIWCLTGDNGEIIPLGQGKSLEYALSLKDRGYVKGDDKKLFKFVEVTTHGICQEQ